MMQTKEGVIGFAMDIADTFGFNYKQIYSDFPNKDLPYHNWYHTCCVVVNCYKIGRKEKLSWDSMTDLIMAAFYHDYNHSGGKSSDAENIRKASNRIYDFNASDYDKEKVAHFIRCTHYPFILDPVCIEEEILRDADLLQFAMPDAEKMIIDGLYEEVKLMNPCMTKNDWLGLQEGFVSTMHFFTKTGRKRHDKNFLSWLNVLYNLRTGK